MAHKKAGGSKAGQGSKPKGKRLGIKIYAGEVIKPGEIIVRQKGTKFHPGLGVDIGRDHTIFAKIAGKVKMHISRGKKLISVENSEK